MTQPSDPPVVQSDDRDVVCEALDAANGQCLEDADMWRGRPREAGFRRDAEVVAAVRAKVEALKSAPAVSPEALRPYLQHLPGCFAGKCDVCFKDWTTPAQWHTGHEFKPMKP